jgi:uncharacterized repeat protein (TIGR01451 family)
MWWNAARNALRERKGKFRLPVITVACLLVVLCLGLLFVQPAKAQTVFQYSNSTTGAITDVNCGTAGQITRTFTVPTSYIVGDVNLGVALTHTYRSDLRITLQSPAGTTVAIMTNTGGSGDNLHDLFDDEAAALISTHNATATDPTTAAPPYSHSFRPTAALSAFDGQNAAGTWTMVICDSVAVDVGNFTRADLYITSTSLSVTKTSSVISDGISGANPKSLPGAVVQYCILITNNGTAATPAHGNVVMNDPLPANSSYVTGSMLSGTSCAAAATAEDDDNSGADETDPFGMTVAGTTITGRAASLATNTSFAMLFRVTIN